MSTAPLVTVVIPCFDEEGYIDRLLAGLLPQLQTTATWQLVLVNDSSTDATGEILDAASSASSQVTMVVGLFGSPGGARTAGVAAALAVETPPDWIVTVDADVEVSATWLHDWNATIDRVHNHDEYGALNGGEQQAHLFATLPQASMVSAAFGHALMTSERAVGITNLNGVNHAVRTSAYLTAGPYLQPTTPGPEGMVSLAGEDWDLGLRLRLAGYTVGESSAEVVDRGRRLLTDVHAYVSGQAYEGAFRRLKPTSGASDIDAAQVEMLVDHAIERSLRHFFFKPILAGAVPLTLDIGLNQSTLDQLSQWMQRWPAPTFATSRNGFIFGRLPRFCDAFMATVRSQLSLDLVTVVRHLKAS